MPKVNTDPIFWECTNCGRRYVDSAPVGLFIPPPPITKCIMAQTGEAWTYTNEGFVNVSNTGGAICDYVRTNHVESLTEQIAGPADAASMPKMAVANEHSARAYDRTAMKMEGESGRVSRHNGAVTAICEDDGEDDDFWKARCDDVDCIYVGEHCRYQCATAEVDEEPHHKALFPKRGLRFRPWAT